ncbi:hypothetical protein Forpe1208_v012034 [Fusarium oxysporum f. sp. rapae]|uniref:Uncharacterized protein n=1 Tax=Fusarium oxysporum f. sp. rapae TaxID=485398 RepID=A0A8J5NNT0_FUSOX|nr:hypothetical protein Forpe1208_v012034 [Fusarium oxysporum f. sp. rapae]
MDVDEHDLDGTEDFANALKTPYAIHGTDQTVLWRDCEASIISIESEGGHATVIKKMKNKQGWCIVPRGYALYCVGDGGQLKKKT